MDKSELQQIVEIIDYWYFDWKDKIVDRNIPHRFGFAKEELKRRIEENG